MTVVYWGALTVLLHAQDGRERERETHTGKEKFGETLGMTNNAEIKRANLNLNDFQVSRNVLV